MKEGKMIKRKVLVLISSLVFLSTVVPANATWYYSTPAIWPAAQEKRCYCGVALAQGWIRSLTGLYYSQFSIAPAAVKFCPVSVVLGGVNAGELASIMNNHAGTFAGYRRVFEYFNSWSRQQAEDGIINAIQARRQIALASNTVRSDGSIRLTGHWMNVFAADIAGNTVWSVRVHDPLYNSQWQASYQSLSTGFALPRYDWIPSSGIPQMGLVSRWSGKDGLWQHVTYLNF